MKILLTDLLKKLEGEKYEIRGNKENSFTGFGPLDGGGANFLSFCRYKDDKAEELLINTRASVIFCWSEAVVPENCDKTFILIENPRLHFAKILSDFLASKREMSIHKTAIIGANCAIGKVSIGAYAVIGDHVKIGDGAVISPGVVLGDNVWIGKNTVLKSNTTIGQKGFGFEFDKDGIPFAIPHIGSVRIGDNVEIGSNCTVVRGVLGDTIVSDFTKVDDHVHVGHNVKIGPKTMIAACAEISGSVKIGADCWLGPNCSLMNQIRIGNNVLIGLGAVVTKSLPDNAVVAGNPAQIIRIKNKEESPWKGISR
jgi:UDP-3-O-[3-hydroxymyristoyl] glucosamine N-acyltransferase